MTGDIDEPGNNDQVEDDLSQDKASEEDSDENIVLTTDDDVADASTAEIKVDELVAEVDSVDAEEAERKREIHQKLEALRDQQDDEFGSTYNFNIDEDL